MAWKAVVTGGTGAIGRYLVSELLASPLWSTVTLIGRSRWVPPADGPSVDVDAAERTGRLRQVVLDMELFPAAATATAAPSATTGSTPALAAVSTHFAGATATFSTLGTTLSDAGSAAAQRRVDVDYVVATARLAKAAGAQHFAVVTSALATTWPMRLTVYGSMKCDVEAAAAGERFPSASIFRPGLLDRGAAARTGEKVALWVLPSIRVQAVARAMRLDAEAALAKLAPAPAPAGTAAVASCEAAAAAEGGAGAAAAAAASSAPGTEPATLRFLENAQIAALAAAPSPSTER